MLKPLYIPERLVAILFEDMYPSTDEARIANTPLV